MIFQVNAKVFQFLKKKEKLNDLVVNHICLMVSATKRCQFSYTEITEANFTFFNCGFETNKPYKFEATL